MGIKETPETPETPVRDDLCINCKTPPRDSEGATALALARERALEAQDEEIYLLERKLATRDVRIHHLEDERTANGTTIAKLEAALKGRLKVVDSVPGGQVDEDERARVGLLEQMVDRRDRRIVTLERLVAQLGDIRLRDRVKDLELPRSHRLKTWLEAVQALGEQGGQ